MMADPTETPNPEEQPTPVQDQTTESPAGETEPETGTADRRSATMDTILETRNQMLRENGVDLGREEEDGETPAEEGEETGSAPAPEDGETTPAAAGEKDQNQAGAAGEDGTQGGAPRQDDPNQETFTVVVDGQQREVTRDELIRGYQIEQTARERMSVATETMQRAEAMERRLMMRDPRTAEEDTGTADGGTGTASSEDPLDAIDFKSVAEALQYKDPDEASQVLKGLVKDLQSQSGADPSATYQEVESRILDRIEWDQATQSFRRDYPDVCDNPQLANMTATRAGQIWAAAMEDSARTGSARPRFADIWNQAGDETRAFVEGLVAKQQGGTADPPPENGNGSGRIDEQRLKDKRDATPPPKPRAVAKPETTPQPRPEEVDLAKRRSDAIAEMQKGRGQGAR